MSKKFTTLKILAGIITLVLSYLSLASWYLSDEQMRETKEIENHAVIISHDLWNLNKSGMLAYLDLVAKTDHYKTLEVITDDSQTFLRTTGPELAGLDAVLYRMALIQKEQISFPVFYEKQEIGVLQGERYIRYVYPLFLIFLTLFFVILTLIFIFYLIFNRRLLEYQVKERTQKYHDLVSLLPEMVLETDNEGYITFANEKAQKCFGISNFITTKHDCREYIRCENGERSDRNIYLNANETNLDQTEYKAQNVTGTLLPVLVRSAPIYRDNQFLGARMVIIDITERKALEEQLTRDQKMKSIGIMAGGVAHDLNNILSGIINYPELLLHQLPKDSPLAGLIEPIKEAGLRAAAVVADLLTVARGVAATREAASLNEIILDYTYSPEFEKLQSLYPKIRYTRKLSPDLDNIFCSVIHVRKSLMNLVNNASEAVDGSGQVIIETSSSTIETPITTGHGIIKPGTYATVAVKDSGNGIPPSELSHILEPFFSKKELGRSGTGLGLTVVWNTMQDHDGGIQINSTANGSTFELYFPSSAQHLQNRPLKKDIDLFMGNGQSILIVDDEFQQRDIATRLLESLGYNVESVSSGLAAIEYVRTTKIDLILLDMILESGMSGRETYEVLIQQHPDLKAIILSGFSESADVKETIRMGAGGLVNKPYTREQLARAVFNELDQS